MTGILVRSLSTCGQELIVEVMRVDDGRSDWLEFFVETVESVDPYVLRVEHRNHLARRMVKSEQLKTLVCAQMDSYGCVEGVDYEVVVL